MLQGRLLWDVDVFLSLYVLLILGLFFFPKKYYLSKNVIIHIYVCVCACVCSYKRSHYIDRSLNYILNQNGLHEYLFMMLKEVTCQSQIKKEGIEITDLVI